MYAKVFSDISHTSRYFSNILIFLSFKNFSMKHREFIVIFDFMTKTFKVDRTFTDCILTWCIISPMIKLTDKEKNEGKILKLKYKYFLIKYLPFIQRLINFTLIVGFCAIRLKTCKLNWWMRNTGKSLFNIFFFRHFPRSVNVLKYFFYLKMTIPSYWCINKDWDFYSILYVIIKLTNNFF